MPTDRSSAHDTKDGSGRTAGAFDIRVFIGSLIGIYGIVLVITGLVSSDGRTINLISGALMIVGAVVFFAWARLRPVVLADPPHE
jgi:hypothetical protein